MQDITTSHHAKATQHFLLSRIHKLVDSWDKCLNEYWKIC